MTKRWPDKTLSRTVIRTLLIEIFQFGEVAARFSDTAFSHLGAICRPTFRVVLFMATFTCLLLE